MWYLFNKKNKCFGTCNIEPNHEDLAMRKEKAIESDLILSMSEVGLDKNRNVIQAAPSPPPYKKVKENLENEVEAYLNRRVRERGYNTIYTASNYATTNHAKYGPEGQACLSWMCDVWDICYKILNEVESGQRKVPTVEELLAELPELIWPENKIG